MLEKSDLDGIGDGDLIQLSNFQRHVRHKLLMIAYVLYYTTIIQDSTRLMLSAHWIVNLITTKLLML